MNQDITIAVADFLAHKRALGRKYHTEEATLRLFTRFTAAQGLTTLGELTAPLLEAFLASRPRHRARSFNHLVIVVSGFLNWSVAQGRLHASPLQRVRRRESDERLPFILTTDQVREVLHAASILSDNPRARNRGMIHRTIFALCYGLGLRAGEACNLRIGDVDTNSDLLTVRGGKFGKSRLVPYGPRIGELLTCRLQECSNNPTDPLFSFNQSDPINPSTSSTVFHKIVTELDFPVPNGVGTPRLHSLRHSFAVGCLLRWYREGIDPGTRLLHLSTFMGHVSPQSTAVYLQITPELLTEGAQRFETYAQPVWTEAIQ